MGIRNGYELLNICQEGHKKIYQIAIEQEMKNSNLSKKEIEEKMMNYWEVMKDAIQKGMEENTTHKGKIIGGEAQKLKKRYDTNKPVCGQTLAKAISYALSVMEVNASMGKIVAAPTAGSSGILPAIYYSLQENFKIEDKEIVQGIFTSSIVGMIIAKNATLSGAEGGCQAEVGSAAAMGAAGIVEVMGGSPSMALDAAAIALKNLMGLVCDPIAGLVESPCSKRNAIGTANALIAAEMALSGINSIIPFDEVVSAMDSVGKMMPCSLRETAQGGIATTPTGLKIKKEIFNQ